MAFNKTMGSKILLRSGNIFRNMPNATAESESNVCMASNATSDNIDNNCLLILN